MAIWLIKRDDGKYVARQGSEHSYTDDIRKARRYDTEEQAKRDLCDQNEHVTTLEIEMS